MQNKIQNLLKEVETLAAKNAQEAEEIRVKWLGKKGTVTVLFDEFKNIAAEEKRVLGQQLNTLKTAVQEKIAALRDATEQTADAISGDYTQPGFPHRFGARHPIAITRNEIIDIFKRSGYTLAEGPEIEDDWHVFSVY